jgi:hypothetical protein
MKEVPQLDVTLSYVALLLEEQRYEEALPILGTLMDMDPSDREARLYRLLVLRILVQRYYLSNSAAASTNERHLIAKRLLTTLAAETSQRLRSFRELYHATESFVANAMMNRLTIAVGACGVLVTPLLFYMAGSQIGIQQRPRAAFIDPAPLIVSAVDLKGHYAKIASASETELSSVIDQERISPLVSEPADLKLPVVSWTELVPAQSIAKIEPRRLRADVANSVRHLPARWAVSKRQESGSPRNIQSQKTPAKETLASKPRKDILAQYQSKRTVSIRESASFAAGVVQEITRGTLVSVVEVRGSWAKIEVGEQGITGFIRKEFLMPVNLGRTVES